MLGGVRVVPQERIRALNAHEVRASGDYVLYWMIAARRTRWNLALDRAIEHARRLAKPLVIFEPLRVGYPWASDRLHRFVLDGMAENQRRAEVSPAFYFPYVERSPDEGKGLLRTLAASACVVVTDDYPCFMLPRMLAAAAQQLEVGLEAIDGNGLYPMRAATKVFSAAAHFRRHLQRELPAYLLGRPRKDPLSRLELPRLDRLPQAVTRRWRAADPALLHGDAAPMRALAIDHRVGPTTTVGGSAAGEGQWRHFLEERLDRYAEDRNSPESSGASGLSPYLHFGHLSAHQIFHDLAQREGWSPADWSPRVNGARTGYWGFRAGAEAFLDQVITWRELGFNACVGRPDYADYDALPTWARATLERHSGDRRPWRYALREFEAAETHDPLWNAAQRQLRQDGTIHNYLRMLWGKKILEWADSPRDALAIMIELNDRYALDGRDPNSYSGIGWCLGKYDRPWAPERPIFGVVRYMSSENTARKYRVKPYLERYAPSAAPELFP